jgi:hypothetical protein
MPDNHNISRVVRVVVLDKSLKTLFLIKSSLLLGLKWAELSQ